MARTDHASCWCQATQKQVNIAGETTGRRQAELFHITDCSERNCPKRHSPKCLVDKEVEGRWP